MPTIVSTRILPASAYGVARNTSTVGECSLSQRADHLLVTGNWYAAHSRDRGLTWVHADPFAHFPPAHGGFCCDQTTLYIPKARARVWLLQYSRSGPSNTLRIAVQTGTNVAAPNWFWWDLVPGAIDPAWSDEWFDYNHATWTDNFLYVSSNLFRGDTWTRCVIFRIPLRLLRSTATLTYEYFESTTHFSIRCLPGGTHTLHAVAHDSLAALQCFSWPEASASVNTHTLSVTAWHEPPTYSAPCPPNPGSGVRSNWLGRCDGRITGGWEHQGVAGAVWSAGQQSLRPFPFVRCVRWDTTSGALIDEPDIWHPDYAHAYPDTCANRQGVVGIALFRGGGTLFPEHVVGHLGSGGTWSLLRTRAGTHGPDQDKWGDYLHLRLAEATGRRWSSAAFTLQGGSTRGHIEAHVSEFRV